jgi:membrane protein involved in colicin uptake
MGRVRAASLVLAALAVGLLLAACGGGGSDELLPGATAEQINSHLDQVQVSYEEGNCEKAEVGVANVSTEVDELGKVDAQLKKALRQGAAKLSEVVSTCRAQEEEQEQAADETAEEEQAEIEAEELAEAEAEEEEAFEREEKAEEREEKAEEKAQEEAEKHAEQPGPSEEGEEANGKAKGHEKQEEIESPVEGEEEVTPPTTGEGPAGGIGPGAEAGGG